MKRMFVFIVALFSLVLSSCDSYHLNMDSPFQVLESDDGVFKSKPNINGHDHQSFYAMLSHDSKSFLLICNPMNSNMESKLFNYKNEISNSHILEITRSRDGIFEMSFNYNSFDASDSLYNLFKEWKNPVSLRDTSDDELDAKYYTDTYYSGLDGNLVLEYVPYLSGFLIDKNGNKKLDLRYYDKSSIFTFKLLCYYNDEEYIFTFLENNNFSIRKDDEIVSNGNYSSNRNGMVLSFLNDSIFNLDSIELTIDSSKEFFKRHFYDNGKKPIYGVDLAKYINSDYEFWIQQYEAENP